MKVEKIKSEIKSYINKKDFSYNAKQDFKRGANYTIENYVTPLAESHKELFEALENIYEYSLNGGSGDAKTILIETETALSNAKKLINE